MEKAKREKIKEYSLTPMVLVSAAFHVLFVVVFLLVPSREPKADDAPDYDIQEVNIVYSDEVGSGVWGTPKKGTENIGKIIVPPNSTPVQVPSADSVNVKPENKKPENKKTENRHDGPDVPDEIRKAIESFNEGRDGEYTRPDGDPNSANPGPAGPPGGDICSVYRKRASRQIRRAGSVPEADGKSTTVRVSIAPSGAVAGKSVVSSSGIPHADSVALSLIPGSFGAPPAECGSVSITVKVRFHGGASGGAAGGNDGDSGSAPQRRKPPADDPIQRALDGL